MRDDGLAFALLDALRAGDEALDRGARGPAREIALLRDAGLLSAPLPIDAGGRGWGTSPAGAAAVCDALIALGGASLPIARLYEGHVNAVKLIMRFGDTDQRAWLATAVGGGAMLGVWGADSDTPVTIRDADGAAALVGTKAFASGLGDLSFAIVTAKADDGLQMVIVPADDPSRFDHADWDVDAMVGSRSGRFACDGLPATCARRLGGPDAMFAEPDFHGGVWRIAACHAGAMARLARLSAACLDRRGQCVDPLPQARLGAVAIEAETAVLWARHAALIVEGAAEPGDAVAVALFAREAVEQAAVRMLAMVERLAGTAMHRRGSALGRVARDLRFYLRQADLDGKLALATSRWNQAIIGEDATRDRR